MTKYSKKNYSLWKYTWKHPWR